MRVYLLSVTRDLVSEARKFLCMTINTYLKYKRSLIKLYTKLQCSFFSFKYSMFIIFGTVDCSKISSNGQALAFYQRWSVYKYL